MGRRGPNATPIATTLPPLGQSDLFGNAVIAPHLREHNALPSKTRKKANPLWLRVCDFIEQLPVTKGLLVGEKMRVWPWQRENIIKPIYKTGGGRAPKRVVREAFISIPRKNGKTGLAAGLVLAHLCGPLAEPRGEIYSLGADRDQASITYREVNAIRELVPELAARLLPREYEKEVLDTVTGTIYKALSADAPSKLGKSTSFFIYDEFAQAPNQKLWDAISTSTGARREPLGLVISTQARDDSHPMSQMLDHALAATRGEIDDPYTYGYLEAAPEEADPWSEDTWAECNPGLGNIRSLEDLKFHANKAKHIPSLEASFRNYYLNQRVAAASGFLSPSLWKACYVEREGLREELKGETCFIGLDLAQVRDLCSMAAYFPTTGHLITDTWIPTATLNTSGAAPYQSWVAEGYLHWTQGRAINKRAILAKLAQWTNDYHVHTFAYDRWGIDEIERLIYEENINVPNPTAFGQNFPSMSPAIDELEALILEEQLRVEYNPLLTWCFSNIAVDTDPAEMRRFTKKKASGRIDPMVAMVMAVGQAAKTPLTTRSFASSIVTV